MMMVYDVVVFVAVGSDHWSWWSMMTDDDGDGRR